MFLFSWGWGGGGEQVKSETLVGSDAVCCVASSAEDRRCPRVPGTAPGWMPALTQLLLMCSGQVFPLPSSTV